MNAKQSREKWKKMKKVKDQKALYCIKAIERSQSGKKFLLLIYFSSPSL